MTVLGKKINLASLLGALVVFFLPWLDMQCNANSMLTQSGVQAVYGGASLSDQMKQLQEMGDNNTPDKGPLSEEDRPKPAWLAAGGLLLILLTLILATKAVFTAGSNDFSTIALLSTLAFGLVLLQVILGFPIEGTAEEAMAQTQEGGDAAAEENPFGGLGTAMVNIQVVRQPWLWFELVLLAVPGLMWVNNAINQRNAPSE